MPLLLRIGALLGLYVVATLGAIYTADRLRPPDAQPILSMALPGPVAPLLQELELALNANGGRATLRALEIGAAVLRRAPLEAAPLILAADAAMQAGDAASARANILRAFERDPRNAGLLAWLAEDAAVSGDLEAALVRLESLFVIAPQNGEQYASAVAAIASLPDGQPLVERALLQGNPSWGGNVANRLMDAPVDTGFLRRLAVKYPKSQEKLLRRLISELGLGGAYVAWRDLLPQDTQVGHWPYDPDFRGRPGPPPFNWELSNGAELQKQGGLYASYDGRGVSRLASQIVLLPPGSHRLQASAETESRLKGGRLVFAVQCLLEGNPGADPKDDLVVLELENSLRKRLTAEVVFVVPLDNCSAQRLVLRGEPSEFTLWAKSEIFEVKVLPADQTP